MPKPFWIFFFFLGSLVELTGQSYAVVVKGGGTMAFQQWQGANRSPTFLYHGKLGIESAEEDESYNLYSELGYHQRGSALRNAVFRDFNSANLFQLPTQEYIFHNISLNLGAKSKKRIGDRVLAYYGLAVRGEYTFDTNLDTYREIIDEFYGGVPVFPVDELVEKWNYGIDVTGGFEYQMSEYVNGVIELRISPDFSPQYRQPRVDNILSPFPGGSASLNEQRAFNVSIELSVGLRFLRKIVYID